MNKLTSLKTVSIRQCSTHSRRVQLTLILLATFTFYACSNQNAEQHPETERSIDANSLQLRQDLVRNATVDEALIRKAIDLADKLLVVDTHVDAPIKQYYQSRDLTLLRDDTEFDIPRAIAGGLNVVFMSIYTSARAAVEGNSKEIAEFEIDFVENLVKQVPDFAAVATCTKDIALLQQQGKLALPLGMENASPLQGDVEQLDYWYQKGIRYITITHSKSNEFSDSSYDENERWKGLSEVGVALVKAMNTQGIMIDISHLSDRAAWQVLHHSSAPVVATHSSLRHFIPGFHRNMSDKMLSALAEQGGVIMINFGSSFVSAAARDWSNQLASAIEEFSLDQERSREEIGEFRETYRNDYPYPFASVGTVADHIDRVVELTSIDHVGLGSDFDGVGPTLPVGLKDISQIPNLIVELIRRGYSEVELEKILGLNFMRVWEEVEQQGAQQGNPPVCRH